MRAQVIDETHRNQAVCSHFWRREREVEEGLSTVVYVRRCAKCGQLEAKAGHKDPSASEGWELIEGETAKLDGVLLS